MAFLTTLLQLLLLPLVAVFGLLAHLLVTLADVLTGTGKKLGKPRSIVITGATSGIGEALALYYAKAGITLALTGRNKQRLQEVAAACEAKGATVKQGVLDVTDRDAMAKFLLKVDKEAPVECAPFGLQRARRMVVANAGVSESVLKLEHELEQATKALFATNVDGVFNTVLPLLEAMKERRAGRIVIMSSMASVLPLAGSVAYCASKAAVRAFGESLRAAVYRDGIRVNVMCPAYIESAMTQANKFKMPGIITMDSAVRTMTRAIAADVPVCFLPASHALPAWAIARVLPMDLSHALARRRWAAALSYLRPKRRAAGASSAKGK